MKHFTTRLARFVVAGVLASSLAGIAGVASAASDPGGSPEFVGALNMLHALGAGTNGGMEHAMSVNNANGDAGMWCAVRNSGTPNPYCP